MDTSKNETVWYGFGTNEMVQCLMALLMVLHSINTVYILL